MIKPKCLIGKYAWIPVFAGCLLLGPFGTVAQQTQRPTTPPVREGEVDDQEITIEKNRKIELPPANRLFNKIPSVKPSSDQRKLTYEFNDRTLTVGDPKLSPVALDIPAAQAEQQSLFNNYIKAGAGNYGSFYGEAFGSGQVQENISVDGSFRHLSSSLGPVDGKNSATSENRLKLNGYYQTDAFKLSANLAYDRDVFYFYGYRRPREIDRETIKQRLNTTQFRVGIENVDPEKNIDYSLKTGITTFRDNYDASEFDWGTNLKGSVGISESLVALFAADAFVTQRTDGPVDNRNLFRVKPTFKYSTSFLTITAGVNAVNESDKRQNINRTRAFPVLDLDIVPAGNIHFFAGVDGDINRNTLRTFLTENRWLAPKVVLANTEKTWDLYGGSKGELGGGFSYEGKVSYARYRNFYGFNNTWPDTSKFFVVYDSNRAQVLTISGQIGYTFKDFFRSTLRANFYDYSLSRMEAAWSRPTISGSWSNSVIVNKKLFVTADLYHYQGMQNKNFVSGQVFTLKPIWDMNLKIDYFLGKQVSAFVSLNNIFGGNYQRYLYYPQQGLNFLGGLSYSF
ncbi:TonB-dependent receptor [Larkinella soli]|uniref:TonB-dependent receptor n=1 Tax=Larkinella soli TaxID=1770527 RepID=UPI001E542963|nr:TonB-dependent receptor [Larkinella soli]